MTQHARQFLCLTAACCLMFLSNSALAAAPGVVFQGGDGPGNGKHIVLVAGDEEYRSEEAMPMLAKILAVRHGFKCTVLFSMNPEDGTVNPNNQECIPGLEILGGADMMVLGLRFRELPDNDMKHFADFVNSGKPIMGLRTSTHSFRYSRNPDSPYAKYGGGSKQWAGGFGQHVLGEKWAGHHGKHKSEATRGLINGLHESHPILNGVKDVFGPTDVYTVKNLTNDAIVLMYGQVLQGMNPDDPPNNDKPIMPLVWTKAYTGENEKTSRIICTTMGASVDLVCEDLRRLVVNACYWGLGLEEKIPERANVDYVGEYQPTFYGFGQFKPGVKPSDHAIN